MLVWGLLVVPTGTWNSVGHLGGSGGPLLPQLTPPSYCLGAGERVVSCLPPDHILALHRGQDLPPGPLRPFPQCVYCCVCTVPG